MIKESIHSDLTLKWKKILEFIELNFNKKPDLNAILFLIGVRELGQIPTAKFKKDEKVHLMHIANCKVLSYSNYYAFEGFDELGWPVWKSIKPLPNLHIFDQEMLLKQHIIEYFENEEIIDFNSH